MGICEQCPASNNNNFESSIDKNQFNKKFIFLGFIYYQFSLEIEVHTSTKEIMNLFNYLADDFISSNLKISSSGLEIICFFKF